MSKKFIIVRLIKRNTFKAGVLTVALVALSRNGTMPKKTVELH